MVLKIVNKRIVGFGSFDHKDTFKFYGCLWDNETKSWYIPDTANHEEIQKVIDTVNENENQKILNRWKESCKACNVPYAKKGTPEYEQVLEWLKLNKNI
jgi:hypothetical protein